MKQGKCVKRKAGGKIKHRDALRCTKKENVRNKPQYLEEGR